MIHVYIFEILDLIFYQLYNLILDICNCKNYREKKNKSFFGHLLLKETSSYMQF